MRLAFRRKNALTPQSNAHMLLSSSCSGLWIIFSLRQSVSWWEPDLSKCACVRNARAPSGPPPEVVMERLSWCMSSFSGWIQNASLLAATSQQPRSSPACARHDTDCGADADSTITTEQGEHPAVQDEPCVCTDVTFGDLACLGTSPHQARSHQASLQQPNSNAPERIRFRVDCYPVAEAEVKTNVARPSDATVVNTGGITEADLHGCQALQYDTAGAGNIAVPFARQPAQQASSPVLPADLPDPMQCGPAKLRGLSKACDAGPAQVTSAWGAAADLYTASLCRIAAAVLPFAASAQQQHLLVGVAASAVAQVYSALHNRLAAAAPNRNGAEALNQLDLPHGVSPNVLSVEHSSTLGQNITSQGAQAGVAAAGDLHQARLAKNPASKLDSPSQDQTAAAAARQATLHAGSKHLPANQIAQQSIAANSRSGCTVAGDKLRSSCGFERTRQQDQRLSRLGGSALWPLACDFKYADSQQAKTTSLHKLLFGNAGVNPGTATAPKQRFVAQLEDSSENLGSKSAFVQPAVGCVMMPAATDTAPELKRMTAEYLATLGSPYKAKWVTKLVPHLQLHGISTRHGLQLLQTSPQFIVARNNMHPEQATVQLLIEQQLPRAGCPATCATHHQTDVMVTDDVSYGQAPTASATVHDIEQSAAMAAPAVRVDTSKLPSHGAYGLDVGPDPATVAPNTAAASSARAVRPTFDWRRLCLGAREARAGRQGPTVDISRTGREAVARKTGTYGGTSNYVMHVRPPAGQQHKSYLETDVQDHCSTGITTGTPPAAKTVEADNSYMAHLAHNQPPTIQSPVQIPCHEPSSPRQPFLKQSSPGLSPCKMLVCKEEPIKQQGPPVPLNAGAMRFFNFGFTLKQSVGMGSGKADNAADIEVAAPAPTHQPATFECVADLGCQTMTDIRDAVIDTSIAAGNALTGQCAEGMPGAIEAEPDNSTDTDADGCTKELPIALRPARALGWPFTTSSDGSVDACNEQMVLDPAAELACPHMASGRSPGTDDGADGNTIGRPLAFRPARLLGWPFNTSSDGSVDADDNVLVQDSAAELVASSNNATGTASIPEGKAVMFRPARLLGWPSCSSARSSINAECKQVVSVTTAELTETCTLAAQKTAAAAAARLHGCIKTVNSTCMAAVVKEGNSYLHDIEQQPQMAAMLGLNHLAAPFMPAAVPMATKPQDKASEMCPDSNTARGNNVRRSLAGELHNAACDVQQVGPTVTAGPHTAHQSAWQDVAGHQTAQKTAGLIKAIESGLREGRNAALMQHQTTTVTRIPARAYQLPFAGSTNNATVQAAHLPAMNHGPQRAAVVGNPQLPQHQHRLQPGHERGMMSMHPSVHGNHPQHNNVPPLGLRSGIPGRFAAAPAAGTMRNSNCIHPANLNGQGHPPASRHMEVFRHMKGGVPQQPPPPPPPRQQQQQQPAAPHMPQDLCMFDRVVPAAVRMNQQPVQLPQGQQQTGRGWIAPPIQRQRYHAP